MIHNSTFPLTVIFFKKRKQLLFILTWFVSVLFPFYGTAQNPGGVAGEAIWYKANAGITLNASTVSQWNDFSGNANNGTQVTAANQPAYATNSINFNQGVTFSGTNYLTAPVTGLPSGVSARSVFVVASFTNAQTGNSWIYGYGTNSPSQAFNVGKLLNVTSLYVSGYSRDAQSTLGFWTANTPKLGTVTYDASVASFYDAGNPIGTAAQTGINTVLTANSGRIGSFVNSANEQWRGTIAEVVLYPSLITGSDAAKIESYLAIKYGIHKAGNYINSAGTIVWDATANLVYDNDVFGIGQDDSSGLLQTQSNSANTGSGNGTGQTGTGNIVISTPSALANNGFLMIGHDIGALTEVDLNIAGLAVKRVLRTWKVQSAGNPGTVTLSYDITGLTYSGQSASDYVLMVDPTGTGDFTGGSVVKYTAVSLAGNKASFNAVNLPTGAVFTFQTLSTPTVQATNVVFTATTGTTTTASWTNGNGTSRAVFMFAGSTGTPVPVNATTYTANTVFGTGTQIGTSGWYCVYNGTGTTVNITGLSTETNYQVMVIERNGPAANELYLSTVSTGNPAGVLTLNPTILGPGGVSANLKLWLKANSNVTPSTQGGAVTTWNDRSGGNNNATYVTPLFAQTVLNPTYQLNSLNFNATVRFNGTSITSFSAIGGTLSPAVTSNNISAYAVYLMNGTSGSAGRILMISQNATTSDWQNQAGADLISRSGTNIYGVRNNIAGPVVGPVAGIPVMVSTNLTTTNQWRSEINGNSFTTTAYTTTAFNAGYYRLGVSTFMAVDYLNGDIAEVVLYDADKSSSTGHNQIESYLSLKYGIHKTGSYVNSSGTNIWDAATNAVYHNDVFGIGQDDASGLLQTQSNSVNNGGGDGTGQTGKGNIIIRNASSLVNNGFLIIGHDTSALTEISVTVGGNYTKRVQRIWKAQTTGNPGNITVSYDITGLTYSALSFSDYVLLVDPTGTGNFKGGSVVKYPAASLTANKVSFNTVNLPTGSVFTFQTLSNPIVQATNVVFTNTTATTTTASWTNGNGSSRAVFIYTGSSGSPVPADNTTYTANTIFGTGTQIGTTGWYCVYNGTGTTVNITGLAPETNYQVMTVEYDGTAGNEVYQSTVSTGNPAGFTTLNNVASLSNLIISRGILDPVFATGTTSYSATVANAVTSLTLTPTTTASNATVTVNGIAVISGSASGAINLAVGPNTITTVVTAQDGTTIETYTVTVTRTAPPTIVTTGTLLALTTTYGTPSVSTNFSVSGTNMLEGIVVTAPYGFEVSTDDTNFSNDVTIGTAGSIAATTVYIRLLGILPAGDYSGNIVLTSASAASIILPVINSIVNPAVLTVVADNKTKAYADANPSLTVSYSGFVNGDDQTSLTTEPLASTGASITSPVGTYPITAAGGVSSNYTFDYVAGTLTVTPVVLTVTADDKTKAYADANPAFTVSYSGFVNGDTELSLTTAPVASTGADATSPVGTYPITAAGGVSSNYTFDYVAGTLTVTPVVLTVTADDKTKAYADANPAFTVSYSGFVNGDTELSLTNQASASSTADATSPAGTYPITAAGGVSSNYTFDYVAGTLTVTPVVLTVTADDKTKAYADVNPAFTVSYSGFVNGDTELSLTTAPVASTGADATSPAGTYPITAAGGVSSNYTFDYVAGTLTVTPVVLTVTADDKTKAYADANPAFTVSYSGFVNGDTELSLTTAPVASTGADATSPVGTYPITAAGGVSSNYTFDYVAGTLTVTPVVLTVVADNKTKVYGAANPPLTASYSGFVNGDTVESLTTQPTISTIANATSPVGVYAIVVSGAVAPNYAMIYVTGVLTVTSSSILDDADLSSLTVSNGVLTPAFSPNTLLYNVTVGATITTETIAVAADDSLDKITINGVPVSSGNSSTVSLATGVNTFVITVTSEDGLTTKTYVLTITRQGSDDATLSNLTISKGILDPYFKSDITDYNAVVKYDVNSITVTPTVTDPGAKITVNGIAVASSTASAPINLVAGENIIETVVTAADGITKEIYVITVYKGVSPDELVINNILSPNGDGKNDFWVIKDIELFPNNKVTVFDRAGRIVYSKNSYSNEWDGSYSGSPLNNDTYYYLIDLGDSLPKIKGFITILRD